ncbi:UNVERIFIED_CONTAM: hypothetical protein FKN15_047591 [Acipenser sinensis]
MTAAKDSGATPTKGRTLRLHWSELCDLPTLPKVSRFGSQTIWATLEPVNVDTNQLQYLFESKSGGLAAFKEIAEPLFNLKLAMEQLVGNKTFRCILATVLAIGNFLNGCKAKGFELGYLEKLPEVRDTVSRQPLLHHTCTILLESFPETTDLHSEIPALTKSARVADTDG